jgi:YaiO family outer membrane protein
MKNKSSANFANPANYTGRPIAPNIAARTPVIRAILAFSAFSAASALSMTSMPAFAQGNPAEAAASASTMDMGSSSGNAPAGPAGAPGAAASAPGVTPLPPEKSAVEAMVGYGSFSDGYGDAQSYSLRGMQVMPFGILEAEAVNQSRFGFTGNYGGLHLTKDLGPDWYFNAGAGAGSSLLFPSWRTDGTIYRKFGAKRQWVAGLGAYYAKGNAALRSDTGVVLSGIYYGDGFVLEGGLRANRADPGAVVGPSQYFAATIGSDDRRALILRVEHAKETYQVLTTGVEKVDYNSNSVGAIWHERITRDGMLIVGLSYYKNPNYSRAAVDLGYRWSFR